MEKLLFIVFSLLGTTLAGVICGVFPLAVSLKRNKLYFGWLSMLICIIACFLGGLRFGFPVMLILISWILLKSKRITKEEMDKQLKERIKDMNIRKYDIIKAAGALCIMISIVALILTLILRVSDRYKNIKPGLVSILVYELTNVEKKRERPTHGEIIEPASGILLSEDQEIMVLEITIIILCLLSFAAGLFYEKFKGESLWGPGGIMFSTFSLIMISPIFGVIMGLTALITLLRFREKRLASKETEAISETKKKNTE